MTLLPIKTAVIGYGFSAKTFHIPFVSALAEFDLVAISTSNGEAVAKDWPTAQHYASASDLLSSSDAELVIITAPNDVHFDLAKQALENGKHVIIEKPFVTNVSDGEELIALAKEKGLILSVYHNRRWDGDFLTVKKLIEEKRIGELRHFESHFDRFRPEVRQRWREQATDGGGILFDLGSHLIDQALELFGLPDAISAECKMMREGSTNVDYFDVVMHYPNHLAIVHGDLFSAGPNKRFTLKGTEGSYEKLGLDPQEPRLIEGVEPTSPDWADESPDNYGYFYNADNSAPVITEQGGYQHYFLQMADAIRNKTAPPVSAEDALWNIKLIELAMESSRLGQKLPIKNV
ncbi:oxidoreductase [Vibrio sp. EJY3]|uniref:oxidoreductase n=1 Tax=Vibrio sp. (strain EJY3) TaxID=1116375 RepID=UPI000243BD07|nr:oxidoreductase [Vibrio sp. EJY3]AEX24488.1 oxidoreductase domain-containing protein [Vibrio sp. EJY3]